MQSSGEHIGVCLQAFALAQSRLDEALGNPLWTAALEQEPSYQNLPPAVILDIDETVLDNSPYFAGRITNREHSPRDLWKVWSEERAAQPLPGAREFVTTARSKSIEVFFVTNRPSNDEANTRRNLNSVGITVPHATGRDPKAPDCAVFGTDRVLTRLECDHWDADKTTRRAAVAKRYRILMIIGDDLNDFVSSTGLSPGERRQLAREYDDYWGSRWIILPNSMYGSWERVLDEQHHSLGNDELGARRRALDPFTE